MIAPPIALTKGTKLSFSGATLLTISRNGFAVILCRLTYSCSPFAAVMFFRFVTSAEVQRRAEFFEPFILGLTNLDVKKVSFAMTVRQSMSDSLPLAL